MAVAKFTTYRTYYDLYSVSAPKGKRKSPKEYYVDGLGLLAKTIIDPTTLRPLCPNTELYEEHVKRKEDWPLFLTTHECEYEWYRASRPVFKIFPGMVDALAHTSIDVECEHIELPFPAFKIDLPAGNLLGQAYGEKGYDGLFVTTSDILNFENMEGGQGVKLCIFATRSDVGEDYGKVGYKGYCRIMADCGTFPFSSHHSMLALPIIDQSMTVAELLAKYDEQMVQHDHDFGQRMARRRVLSLVIATMLIAISHDKRLIKPEQRGVKHRLKADRARKRGDKAAGLAGNKGFLIGADIKLPKDLRRAMNEPAGTVGSSLNYGHIRSGHLRVQPYGKKCEKKTYKVIFIAPSLVRPDLPLKPKLTDRAIKGV